MEKTSFKKQLSQLFVAATVGIVLITVLTKVSFTSYRVNHRKYAIPQTERNMELISHYKDSMLLALTGLTLYITIGFAGLFPFTPIGITFFALYMSFQSYRFHSQVMRNNDTI